MNPKKIRSAAKSRNGQKSGTKKSQRCSLVLMCSSALLFAGGVEAKSLYAEAGPGSDNWTESQSNPAVEAEGGLTSLQQLFNLRDPDVFESKPKTFLELKRDQKMRLQEGHQEQKEPQVEVESEIGQLTQMLQQAAAQFQEKSQNDHHHQTHKRLREGDSDKDKKKDDDDEKETSKAEPDYSKLDVLNAIAQGLNIEPEAMVLEECMIKYDVVKHRILRSANVLVESLDKGGMTIYIDKNGKEIEVTWIAAWLEFAKSLYDFSHYCKECYSKTENNFYVLWLFLNHYESMTNYLINMVPNSLAYAIYFAQWAEKIEELQHKPEKQLELYFVYAVIFRKLFLFDYIPDQYNDDLLKHDLEDIDDDEAVEKLFARNKHLKEADPLAQDPETQAFLLQYARYGRFLGFAFKNAIQEVVASSQNAFEYLATYTGTQYELEEFASHETPFGLLLLTAAQFLSHLGQGKKHRLRQQREEWDLSYPGEHVERGFFDYFWFSYNAVLQFVWEITRVDRDKSLTFHCDRHVKHSLYEVEQVRLIYTDFEAWRKRETFLNNVKPIIFAHIELLELPYPTSRICTQVSDELYAYFEEYDTTFESGSKLNLIAMNFFTNMGSILSNMVQFDDCFEAFDGECVGGRLGKSTYTLLNPDVVAKWAALENNELY